MQLRNRLYQTMTSLPMTQTQSRDLSQHVELHLSETGLMRID